MICKPTNTVLAAFLSAGLASSAQAQDADFPTDRKISEFHNDMQTPIAADLSCIEQIVKDYLGEGGEIITDNGSVAGFVEASTMTRDIVVIVKDDIVQTMNLSFSGEDFSTYASRNYKQPDGLVESFIATNRPLPAEPAKPIDVLHTLDQKLRAGCAFTGV